ncbi:hypothetical protein I8748_16015 [Nostoc sp. CENA67]|uniref:Uncharacterized protein n=1 Tax=Amazonocrinis nigriterrae CENA67 TaxID=2794033 RepID=A0A8J7L8S7_9NOST|nr:hypothetical protein [Amazonocrinis nigriterrae]MBH8563678.1 hypothetical protein [Amazonocrinis nigriterrae CENA67]
MKSDKSIILLEFNELCPSLMQRFIQEGKLPNFQRFYEQSEVYTTDAEEQAPFLEPWIQWVTVHSGLPYSEHQVFLLDEGYKLKAKSIWDIVSEAGLKVWVCGSMNVNYHSPLNGYVMPDFWSTKITPNTAELIPYFRFVQKQVQEHTNDYVPLSRAEYLRFLGFMSSHGLSLQTINAIIQQLIREKITAKYRWQRATIADKLQFDLFCWYYRKLKPQFSTFFINSTAHFQHMYWRNMEPEQFQVKPSATEQREYEKAILFGYQEMDQLIGGFLNLLDNNTTLILSTALSQQPCLTYENIGGKHLYRPRKFEKLLEFAGINSKFVCSPVMAEEFHIRFENNQDATEAEQNLLALQVNQRPMMRLRRTGNDIYGGCGIFDELPNDATLTFVNSGKSIPFFKIFYQIEEIKSGMHHPDGILWIRKPNCQHSVHQEKVSLLAIAPTILELLDVPKADFMKTTALV